MMAYNMSIHILINSTVDFANMLTPETPDLSKVDYPVVIKYKPLWEIIVKTCFYVPVVIFGIIGNVVVIAVVAKNKRMQTTTNYYIVNLAVADCLIALTCSWTHLVDDLTPFWTLGKFFCTFNTFSQGGALRRGSTPSESTPSRHHFVGGAPRRDSTSSEENSVGKALRRQRTPSGQHSDRRAFRRDRTSSGEYSVETVIRRNNNSSVEHSVETALRWDSTPLGQHYVR